MTTGPLAEWEGRPVVEWASRWNVRFEAWETVESTNDRVRALADAGAPPYTIVVAGEQLRGRGRGGRRWISAPECGLWCSILLRPPSAAAPLTPIVVGLALVDTLRSLGIPAGAKWPNDVWIEDRKVAGILCESGGSGVVVGVGLNLRSPAGGFGPELENVACSLEDHTRIRLSRSGLLEALLENLRGLEVTEAELPGPLLRAWDAVDVLAGREVVSSTGLRGTARGIAPDGALLVETTAGVDRLHAGSVRPVDSD